MLKHAAGYIINGEHNPKILHHAVHVSAPMRAYHKVLNSAKGDLIKDLEFEHLKGKSELKNAVESSARSVHVAGGLNLKKAFEKGKQFMDPVGDFKTAIGKYGKVLNKNVSMGEKWKYAFDAVGDVGTGLAKGCIDRTS